MMNTGDAFVNTSSYLHVAASSMLTLEKFLEGVFPAERKIPRRTKDKNTLDVDAFGSDLPKHISLKDFPDSVCHRDIELFYLKDLQSKRDVLCAIIEFRNLKGRPEGADGRQALKELGRDARFEDDIGHYNYRRWTANEVNTHKRAICQNPEILQLRREKRELMAEMRSVAGTIKNARDTFPHLFQRHETVKKDLAKLRKTLAIETRETARKAYFNNAPVLEVDRQIKQMLLGESDVEERDADSSAEKDWELPIPDYVFPERARLVENFYGPEAEDFDEDKLLTRRIQVTKDMDAHLLLCEPSKRGNRVNWDLDADEDITVEQPEQLESDDDAQICLTDVCIICFGESRRSASNPPPHKFPSKRPDSLRRHLIDSHLLHAHDGISCNWEAYKNLLKFAKITEFLAHAYKEHKYDINIKLCHLTERLQASYGDGSSGETSVESENRQGTETPASSVDFDMTNIDPRLMRPSPITAVKPSTLPDKYRFKVGGYNYTASDEESTGRKSRTCSQSGIFITACDALISNKGAPRKAAWEAAESQNNQAKSRRLLSNISHVDQGDYELSEM
ncbi:uncharacterized protein N7511_003538 [Penicillium nucicola]|uniref:uncharacterized protein n=1 Tax=Penicillium nucicola TaxID=1850975 RepID=UPI002544FB5E|nr:uncharacterized protein N7511_003538 [Penicillium nucicola]KAJ5771487.1 hypothetical protein N7511_003538 [Penicillium nucicola]